MGCVDSSAGAARERSRQCRARGAAGGDRQGVSGQFVGTRAGVRRIALERGRGHFLIRALASDPLRSLLDSEKRNLSAWTLATLPVSSGYVQSCRQTVCFSSSMAPPGHSRCTASVNWSTSAFFALMPGHHLSWTCIMALVCALGDSPCALRLA